MESKINFISAINSCLILFTGKKKVLNHLSIIVYKNTGVYHYSREVQTYYNFSDDAPWVTQIIF